MHRNRSIVFALLLIAIGVVLLLRTSGVIPEDVRVWPVVLVAIGVWLLVERLLFGGRAGEGFVWPLVLIAIGGVVVLQDAGTIKNEDVLGPVILISIGLGIVLSAVPRRGRGPSGQVHETVALDGAASARVQLKHGAGRLSVRSVSDPGLLLDGTFGGAIDKRVRRSGDVLDVRVTQRSDAWLAGAFPWNWGHTGPFDWTIRLSRAVPLHLEIDAGANQAELDLGDLTVEDLVVNTGASETKLTLPTKGRTTARIKAGAASVKVRVPERTAARIVVKGGLTSVKVDEIRFPSVPGGHQSRDYEEAENRVDLEIDAGAATVEVR